MEPTQRKTIKTLALGGLTAVLGAWLGGILLGAVLFARHPTQEPRALFALLLLSALGAFLGAIAATLTVAVRSARANNKAAAALLCVSGGAVPLLCTGAIIYFFPWNDFWVSATGAIETMLGLGVPFLMSLSLVIWGVSHNGPFTQAILLTGGLIIVRIGAV